MEVRPNKIHWAHVVMTHSVLAHSRHICVFGCICFSTLGPYQSRSIRLISALAHHDRTYFGPLDKYLFSVHW